MRATSKCNAVDVSDTWTDESGVNAIIASGHMDGSLRFWDLRSGSRSHCVSSIHTDQVTSVQFSLGSSNLLLTNSRDNTLKLVDTRTYEAITCLRHPNYRTPTAFSRACLAPGATFAAAGSIDHAVYVWDLALGSESSNAAAGWGLSTGTGSQRVVAVLESHEAPVVGCHWSARAPGRLASCDTAGVLCLWG
ncbi:unnamed protein product [Discosporangium mesarthrocarpum]